MQVLKFEFQKFRILEILNFHLCRCLGFGINIFIFCVWTAKGLARLCKCPLWSYSWKVPLSDNCPIFTSADSSPSETSDWLLPNTGQPRYVKLAYLEYTIYNEVIIHSQAFTLYCFVFQTCLCWTWLSRNLGYIEVVFHSRKLVFCFLTPTCVEVNFVLVKKLNYMNVKQSN